MSIMPRHGRFFHPFPSFPSNPIPYALITGLFRQHVGILCRQLQPWMTFTASIVHNLSFHPLVFFVYESIIIIFRKIVCCGFAIARQITHKICQPLWGLPSSRLGGRPIHFRLRVFRNHHNQRARRTRNMRAFSRYQIAESFNEILLMELKPCESIPRRQGFYKPCAGHGFTYSGREIKISSVSKTRVYFSNDQSSRLDDFRKYVNNLLTLEHFDLLLEERGDITRKKIKALHDSVKVEVAKTAEPMSCRPAPNRRYMVLENLVDNSLVLVFENNTTKGSHRDLYVDFAEANEGDWETCGGGFYQVSHHNDCNGDEIMFFGSSQSYRQPTKAEITKACQNSPFRIIPIILEDKCSNPLASVSEIDGIMEYARGFNDRFEALENRRNPDYKESEYPFNCFNKSFPTLETVQYAHGYNDGERNWHLHGAPFK